MSKSKVKIVTSWTRPGGGTVAHIGLTNLLNDNGVHCTLYGPHEWHMDKCKGDLLKNVMVTKRDILISHFIAIPTNVRSKKHILSCHEKHLFPLRELSQKGKLDLKQYNVIQFVSNSQKKWHSVNHPSVIIPPVVKKLKWDNPKNKVAGVVGSIDKNKQTHLSIERALKDGYEKVLLFGELNDLEYFNSKSGNPLLGVSGSSSPVSYYIESGKAVLMDHEGDKEKMYSQVSEVYHTSISETYGMVEVECKLAGIPFNGPSNNQEILEEKDLLERWLNILRS